MKKPMYNYPQYEPEENYTATWIIIVLGIMALLTATLWIYKMNNLDYADKVKYDVNHSEIKK